MSIRLILAPVRGDGRGESVLGLAAALARRCGAHVDVIHVHARPEDMLPYGVPIPGLLRDNIIEAVANTAVQEEGHLRRLFDDFCRARGLTVAEPDPAHRQAVTLAWHEETGKQAQVIGRLAPLADLVVVARPERSGNLGRSTLEAALFDAAKLTALAPPGEVAAAGNRVVVAWNGGAEAARAVGLALPVLQTAEAVTVLTSERAKTAGLEPEALRRYLDLHEVEARFQPLGAASRDVGEALLRTAGDLGADLLLMGAYGDARRRDLVLGGVTEYVVGHAELPVLLAR